jgi:hypothetical protein
MSENQETDAENENIVSTPKTSHFAPPAEEASFTGFRIKLVVF